MAGMTSRPKNKKHSHEIEQILHQYTKYSTPPIYHIFKRRKYVSKYVVGNLNTGADPKYWVVWPAGRSVHVARSQAARAAAVLRQMEDRSQRTGRPEVLPDTISYATVLHSYANVGNAREAERILDHMERVGGQDQGRDQGHDQDLDDRDRLKANIICYNSTLHGWSKSKEDDAPHRAEDLLRRMERLGRDFPDRGIRPDSPISHDKIKLVPTHTTYSIVGNES